MATSRIIRIFLASSITELKSERDNLSQYLAGADIQNMFLHDNVIIQLIRSEDVYSGGNGEPAQELLNQRLRECEMSVFLFKTKAGERTREEFDVAKELQKAGQHTMYVFCQKVPEKKRSEELKQILQRLDDEGPDRVAFESIGDVKATFIRGLLKYEHELLVSLGERYEVSPKSTQFWSEKERTEKAGDEPLKQYEFHKKHEGKFKKEVHQAIEELLSQVGTIMEDTSKTIADKIYRTKEIYQKADLWASKTDYDKEKYSHLLFDYASFLYDYGMYNDAENVYLRQIPLAEELYGKEHENTATSYNNIGEVYRAQGAYPKALEYLKKALAIREKVLGKEHPDTASTYNNIGAVYYAQGDYPQALEYYGNALAIREKVLGKEHPDTASSYNNIGSVYKKQGDYPQALEYYGRALAIVEKVLGKEHPYTAISYNNIGSVYYQWGKYPEALEYLEKALKILKAKLGDNHPNTKATQEWLDATQAAMKK